MWGGKKTLLMWHSTASSTEDASCAFQAAEQMDHLRYLLSVLRTLCNPLPSCTRLGNGEEGGLAWNLFCLFLLPANTSAFLPLHSPLPSCHISYSHILLSFCTCITSFSFPSPSLHDLCSFLPTQLEFLLKSQSESETSCSVLDIRKAYIHNHLNFCNNANDQKSNFGAAYPTECCVVHSIFPISPRTSHFKLCLDDTWVVRAWSSVL